MSPLAPRRCLWSLARLPHSLADLKISSTLRKQAATVHAGGEAKFPIFNTASARSALRLIGTAKPPLTPAQEADVRRRAAKYLGVSK